MEENKLFHDRFFLERLLGRGNFSEVWLAKDTKTDISVALKIYAPATGLDDQGLNVFAREFSLVVNANHKNLLKPLYYDSCDRKPYLVLPFCKNGSIQKEIGKFTEEQAWRLLRDVASGLVWLHNMNPPIIHQDIKPDNVMVSDNGDFMITDFGVSTHLRSTLRKSMSAAFSSAGTIAYMAPERFSKDNTPIMANDIYSLGATTYEMLLGDTPFGDDGGLVQKKGAEVPDLKGNYSEQLKKVISKCLKTDPWERPTAEQLEKYAEAAINGQHIRFADEKTFMQKYKWLVAGLMFVLLAGCGISAFLVNNYQRQMEEKERQAAIVHRNDSIKGVIDLYKKNVVYQISVGDKHDEGYELAYIRAYEEVCSAVDASKELSAKEQNVVQKDMLSTKDSIESKLHSAYTVFMDKAAMFETDFPDISADFKKRASNIAKYINISESVNKNRDSKKTESHQDMLTPILK